MNSTIVIGISASVFTGISLLPQLVKVIKEKKADGVSFIMLTVLLIGLILWVIYGLKINDWILILSNAFSALINLLIIGSAWRFRKK